MTKTTVLAILLFVSPLALVAQLPSGAVALYPADNNSINDISGNGYNGTLTSTTAATNRFGTSNSSIHFTASGSTGTLPSGLVTAMKDDFTIGYWFNTTMTAPSSSQWYGGSALVDAEVCGGTTDWGTALIDGGKVSMGIGNPDITIKSTSATYNDGAWHFVTATRDEAAGVITLYVDGAQVATTTGTATTARTAPTLIGMARNVCASTGAYTGNLDDVIAYSRALSSTEVSNLYNYYSASPLPLKWVSFTAQARGDHVDLHWQAANVTNNDHFDIERSAGGNSFSTIGSLSNNSGEMDISGGGSYRFTDPAPVEGDDLYRIRQVDIDGRYSWSPTVEVRVTPQAEGIYLRANPVRDAVTLVNTRQQMVRALQVLDLSGRVIISRTCNSPNNLISENVGWLKPGYYFLRISTGENAMTMRFIKL